MLSSSDKECVFCNILRAKTQQSVLAENHSGFVIQDAYPVTQGHTLIIPKRHVSSFFEITTEERNGLFDLVNQAKAELDKKFKPNGYNMGINDGEAAGQTVPHLHIHLIPRYNETGKDPRGGIRWLVPEKADYWSQP